jgi:hypothetical protein
VQLRLDPPEIWIHRLDAGAPVPPEALDAGWSLVARTPGETTLAVPWPAPGASGPYRVLRIDGTLDHALVGVLVQLLLPLAGAGIPVFTVSTFDTDHVLVPADRLDVAVSALRAAGHAVELEPAAVDLDPVGERDWTQVVTGRCPECGLDAAAVPVDAVAFEVARVAEAWTAFLLETDDEVLRTRRAPDTWSPLEYACHVRDVLSLFAQRVLTTLREDEPDLGWWDHEAAVHTDGYNEQDVAAVADDLRRNAEVLAAALARADGGWDRRALRRGEEPFTVAGLARFALHESHHHLADAQAAGR